MDISEYQIHLNAVIQKWFRKVDINPICFNLPECDSETLRSFWKTAYRDARMRAHTFCFDLDELVKVRGFGVMKRVWSKPYKGNCIGRIRVNDSRNFDDFEMTKCLKLTDYNPHRDLNEWLKKKLRERLDNL